MSSTSNTTGTVIGSSTAASPTPSNNGSNNNNNNNSGFPGGASSSLYLFTFLATLLLLLAVSCAIVMRSFVLRRRFRRRVEEALAAGIILPQQHTRGRKDFGEKPHLWDAWLAPSNASWTGIMPVSAKIISDNYTGAGHPKKHGSVVASELENPSRVSRTRSAITNALRFVRPRPSLRSPATPQRTDNAISANEKPSIFPEAGSTNVEDAKLQVSVLIAMPNPYHPHGSDVMSLKGKERRYGADDEEDLPEVMFGVAELPWKVQSNAS